MWCNKGMHEDRREDVKEGQERINSAFMWSSSFSYHTRFKACKINPQQIWATGFLFYLFFCFRVSCLILKQVAPSISAFFYLRNTTPKTDFHVIPNFYVFLYCDHKNSQMLTESSVGRICIMVCFIYSNI